MRYIDGLEQQENPWSVVGGWVHSIMESYNKGLVDKKEILAEFLKNYPSVDFPIGSSYSERLKDSLFKFFINLPEKKYTPIGIEREVLFGAGDIKMRGFVDLEVDGGIIDYKISNPFEGDKLKSKAKQLYLYSIPYKEAYGKYPKWLLFYFVKSRKWSKIKFDEAGLEMAVEWANDVANRIMIDEDYLASPEYFYCKNLCGNRDICTEWKK